MDIANVKVSKMCAFCRYWYDPSNLTIEPKSPTIGLWKYDSKAKKKCNINGLNMPARASCSRYECKV